MFRTRQWIFLLAAALMAAPPLRAAPAEEKAPTSIKVNVFYNPNSPTHPTTKLLISHMREHGDVVIEQWSGISLPSSAKSSLMMSIAGNTAPDIGESWYHIIRQEIRQGFLYPLNEWIGDDLDGNGKIDDDEAKWEGWKKIPEIMRTVATVDGKVYGIPQANRQILGLVYRTDLVEAAGLDPRRPPETWSEFLHWCRVLTDPGRAIPGVARQFGQRGFLIQPNGYCFLPWIESTGGDPVVQIRKSPTTGLEHRFGQDETRFVTDDGEDLSGVEPEWRCELDTPEALRAFAFYHKLRWGKWIRTPDGPLDLEEADARGVAYAPEDVIVGVCRNGLSSGEGDGMADLLARGEVAIAMFQGLDNIANIGIDPNLLSWFPYPADDGMPLRDIHGADLPPRMKGRRTVQTQNHYAVMYPGVGDRPKEERDKIWEAMKAICDEDVANAAVEARILDGLARFVPPGDLERLGYGEYVRDIPQVLRRNYEEIESGAISAITEPWSGFWFNIDMILNRDFSRMLGTLGENWDYVAEMKELTRKANSGIMFDTPEETLAKYRPWAAAILLLVGALFAALAVVIVRSFIRQKGGTGSHGVHSGWLPFLLVVPAIGLILLWRYYPLARGLVMAFQDYKVTGTSRFVGLDNFINLAIDPSFWRCLGRTFYYVVLNIAFAFTAPIILAILLTEIRHLKIFYRTLFFLPQMSSGLVITLMWKLMYNPTAAGFFNQAIGYLNRLPFVNIPQQAWLEDPSIAMVCCIVPTIWAGMGMGSLLYLAALRSIPPDLYEAAEIDGAGFRQKLFRITLPTLLPLIIINFVGTFIGTFQSMGNILLMTFGGPGEATTVIGLRIWQEAYVNLRFGMATSMAVILGALLIGLTYVQIKFLGKVEYRRASDN